MISNVMRASREKRSRQPTKDRSASNCTRNSLRHAAGIIFGNLALGMPVGIALDVIFDTALLKCKDEEKAKHLRISSKIAAWKILLYGMTQCSTCPLHA